MATPSKGRRSGHALRAAQRENRDLVEVRARKSATAFSRVGAFVDIPTSCGRVTCARLVLKNPSASPCEWNCKGRQRVERSEMC